MRVAHSGALRLLQRVFGVRRRHVRHHGTLPRPRSRNIRQTQPRAPSIGIPHATPAQRRRSSSKAPGNSVPPVVGSLIGVLRQQKLVLDRLDASEYARKSDMTQSSIGGHIRHSLDHVQSLIAGFESSSPVCYDQRTRGTAEEESPRAALNKIENVQRVLESLTDRDMSRAVEVTFMVAADGNEATFNSNVAREVQFVSHHAIHHNATVALIASELGLSDVIPLGMGLAPSTADYERRQDNAQR